MKVWFLTLERADIWNFVRMCSVYSRAGPTPWRPPRRPPLPINFRSVTCAIWHPHRRLHPGAWRLVNAPKAANPHQLSTTPSTTTFRGIAVGGRNTPTPGQRIIFHGQILVPVHPCYHLPISRVLPWSTNKFVWRQPSILKLAPREGKSWGKKSTNGDFCITFSLQSTWWVFFPLHRLIQNASKVVSLLLSHRARTDLLWSGHSPLSLAIASGNEMVITLTHTLKWTVWNVQISFDSLITN